MIEQDLELVTLDSFLGSEDQAEVFHKFKDIAIIGLSVRVGEIESADALWEALRQGENLIRPIPYQRHIDADAFASSCGKPQVEYRKSSYLERIDLFDPSAFHILPKDAAYLDPAQRLMLEEAWRAIEDAGLSREILDGSSTGIYVGYSSDTIQYNEVITRGDAVMANRSISGKIPSVIASRLSYCLNLKGPAMMIDTACSSSLVAVHVAAQALQMGDCDQAIVGGLHFSIVPPPKTIEEEVTVESSDAATRTFDCAATGTVGGEGVLAIVLKPLDHAVKDGNHIYAVLKGSAVNQDGRSLGITAPNADAQKSVLLEAWKTADINPAHLSYIEAHGTATKLGDPIEVFALNEAFSTFTDRKQFCALGTIKSNAGHLDSAAGLLGLVKCVLALQHKMIPPTLHFTSPNRSIDFIHSSVYVNDTLSKWESDHPRLCGVSSFGMSGTNCHCILEEYTQEKNTRHRVHRTTLHRERCWVNPEPLAIMSPMQIVKKGEDSLLGRLITSTSIVRVFSSLMSELTHSEVREHMIGTQHVLAGTVYIEMLYRAAKSMISTPIQMEKVVFLSPCIFADQETREVQTVLIKSDKGIEATIQSRVSDNEEWQVHVSGRICQGKEVNAHENFIALLNRFQKKDPVKETVPEGNLVHTGPFWTPESVVWRDDKEILIHAWEKEKYHDIVARYMICPPLLDAGVNCTSALSDGVFCLPYAYGSIQIHRPFPSEIYAHAVKNVESTSGDGEIHIFDIQLYDADGLLLATVKNYAMKRVRALSAQQFMPPPAKIFHTIEWVKDSTSFVPGTLKKGDNCTIVIHDTASYDRVLLNAIRRYVDDRCFELVWSPFSMRNHGKTTFLDPDHSEDIQEYFNNFAERGISHVIFLGSSFPLAENTDQFSERDELWIKGYFQTMKVLAAHKLFGSITVDLLIQGDEENHSPSDMLVMGMGRSIRLEYGRLKLRTVRYDRKTSADQVIQEITNNNNQYFVQLCQGQRYREELTNAIIDTSSSFSPKKGGTYLITGASRGVGLCVAQAIASREPSVRLLLLSRRMPSENEWQRQEDVNGKILKQIATGTKIIPIAASVEDAETLRRALSDEPVIDGIFHCAGIAGGGFLMNRTWQQFDQVFTPKTKGTINLISCAQEKKTRDIVLFSSYSSILAVPGQADYIGANAFMDACIQMPKKFPTRIHVLNWSGFRETGMAKDHGVDMDHSPVKFMNNEEAMNYLFQAMASSKPRLLIGELNENEMALNGELWKQNVSVSPQIQERIDRASKKNSFARLDKTYDITVLGKNGALSPVELKLAQAWAKVLGLREVGYEDKFLEIGGDSLSATYLQKEIDREYPGKLDITDVFVYSSIKSMAEHIEEQQTQDHPFKAKTSSSKNGIRAGDDRTLSTMELLERLAAGELDIQEAQEQI